MILRSLSMHPRGFRSRAGWLSLALLLLASPPVQAVDASDTADEIDFGTDEDLFGEEDDLFPEDSDPSVDEIEPVEAPAQEPPEPDAGETPATSAASDAAEELLPSPPPKDVEEILIRGEQTAEQWQQAPTSVVAFDAETLQAERIQNIQDIADFTPNLEISAPGTNPVLFIRGVGLDDFNANSTSAVAVYQDGIYMNSPAGQLFGFFDTQSVQVLRGPHGGPYRNATAGAILVESAPPSFEPGGHASFTHGNYDLFEGEGAVTGPLLRDEWLAYRVSFQFTDRDGWTKNRCARQPLDTGPRQSGIRCVPDARGRPPTGPKEVRFERSIGRPQKVPRWVNDASSWALRAQLLTGDLSLGETHMEWLWNGHFGRSDAGAFQYQHRGFRLQNPFASVKGRFTDQSGYEDLDGDPFAGDYNFDGPEELDVGGTFLRGRWALGDHEVLWINGYEWHDRDSTSNTDANPTNLAASRFTNEAWQFTSDLRIESYWSEGFSTIFGGYFIREDLEAFNKFDIPLSLGGVDLDQDLDQETRGYALFGDLTWEFFPSWTFHADARFNEEFKQLSIVATSGATVNTIRTENKTGEVSETWRGVSGSASLEYALTEAASVYAKYSRGWKPGHINGGATLSRSVIEPIDPESVNAYEVGTRTDWFDGRLSFDAAFFYYQYQDQQIFQLNVDQDGGFPLPKLINAQDARILGVEADLTANPIEGIDIQLSMAYLDTEYEKFVNAFSERFGLPTDPPTFDFRDIILDYTGNQLVGAPRWSAVGSIQYTLLLPGLRSELVPRVSFTFKDRVFFDAAEGKGNRNDMPANTLSEGANWLLNASLTWRVLSSAAGTLEVRGWGRNLTDEEYRFQSFDATDPSLDFVLDAYGAPRTYGISVRAAF